MGLLDDAIRQHLELKRQHGAPEEELQRQEDEALGPARRDVVPSEAPGGDGEVEVETPPESAEDAPAAEAAEDAPAAEVALDDEQTVLRDSEAQATAEPDAPAELQPAAEPDAPAPYDAAADVPAIDEDVAEDEDEELEPPDPEEPAPDLLGLEEEPEEGEDADVLEDTPDFLQETPEHDRLWFEQKPPRDFDFD